MLDRARSSHVRNLWGWLGVSGNLGILVYYKYAGFLTRNISDTGKMFGFRGCHVVEVALPLGISFFVFHALSYLIDVWNRRISATSNPFKLAFYLAFFPQLIAGPILRWKDITTGFKLVRFDIDRAPAVSMAYPGIG